MSEIEGNPDFHGDEPIELPKEDKLDRMQYAESFAALCNECDSALAIGIFATWGVGKTSLMHLIETELDKNQHHVVWFNVWEHQHVANPVLGLAYAISSTIDDSTAQIKKLLMLVATALGSQVLKMTIGMKLAELMSLGNIYEKEQFLTRDSAMQLRDNLKALVDKALLDSGKKRIVIFIDDLDRCSSDKGLELLDALKLYFNLKNCIFFIGVDRNALQHSIERRFGESTTDGVNYLDKIIQLPFTIPLIDRNTLLKFITLLLPEKLADCKEQLEKGLGRNPRQVKRFINTLALNHELARTRIKNYEIGVLCALLLIQYRRPELYQLVSLNPSLLHDLVRKDDKAEKMRADYLGDDLELDDVLLGIEFPPVEELSRYFYLTDAAGMKQDETRISTSTTEAEEPFEEPGFEFLDEKSIERELSSSPTYSSDERIVDKLLLYRTRRQRVWLITSQNHMYCLIDDAKTRLGNRVVQWRQELHPELAVQAYESSKGNQVIDIGQRKRWLYSRRLHPDARALERRVFQMIAPGEDVAP